MPQRRAELHEWLRHHVPRDPTEAVHRDRMLALLAAAGDPFARHRFEPGHFTASAFVVSPGVDRILLIHHRRLRRWLQPGGHIEPADLGAFAAALREVREETGLEALGPPDGRPPAPFDLDVHEIPGRGDQPRHLHFDVRFLLRSPTDRIAASSDAREARWITPHEWLRLESGSGPRRAVTKLRETLTADFDNTSNGDTNR